MKRPHQTDWNIKKLDEAVVGLKGYIDQLEQSVLEKNGTIAKLEPYPGCPNPTLVERRNYYSSDRDLTVDLAQRGLDEWYVKCQAIREKNAPLIENNQRVYQEAFRYLESIGLPSSETVTIPSRGRRYSPKTESQAAGWVRSLSGISRSDGWAYVEQSYKSQKDRISKFEAENAQKVAEAERQKEVEQRTKSAQIAVLALIAKHNLPETYEARDVLDAILKQNKYLHLAHWLYRNRSDWSEGYTYAEIGLSGFDAETPEEKAIVNELKGYMDDWDGDGRIFRDCTHNYDSLFAVVQEKSPELMQDYQKLCNAMRSLGGCEW